MGKKWYIGLTLTIVFVCALLISSAGAYTTDFPKQYRLWQGTAAMHEIGVYGNCGMEITVESPYGAAFDIYAMKNYGSPGTCPSNEYIMNNYDRYAYSSSGTASMNLDQGLWCVVVYARSGNGMAYVTAESNCNSPGPGPGPSPVPPYNPPSPSCSPYKTVDRSGYLNEGQAAVYGYYIPTDGRSQIEWILSGSSSGGSTPVIVASINGQMTTTTSYKNSNYGPIFDVYVFKDCNPQYSYCNTKYYANGPNAYVSVANPQRGSTYYVMVYARSGNGNYNLRMNSYKCNGNTPIIVASTSITAASVGSSVSTAGTGNSVDTAVYDSVSAPEAKFVSVSSQ
jgi:hypothetical protein